MAILCLLGLGLLVDLIALGLGAVLLTPVGDQVVGRLPDPPLNPIWPNLLPRFERCYSPDRSSPHRHRFSVLGSSDVQQPPTPAGGGFAEFAGVGGWLLFHTHPQPVSPLPGFPGNVACQQSLREGPRRLHLEPNPQQFRDRLLVVILASCPTSWQMPLPRRRTMKTPGTGLPSC